MEITIDLAFVRGILEQEHQRARGDITSAGVVSALESSHERHDSRIVSAPDVSTLACRAGCMWCCYYSVDVRAVEAFTILDFVERTFALEQQERVFAEVRANSAALKNADDVERMQRNVKCPFLQESRCSIYAVRPQMCRNYHATSAVGCQLSYEDPENLDIDPEFAPYVYQAGNAHVEAFTNAMREAGYDTNVYELNTALNAALSDAGARERFQAKLAPFSDLPGDDIPPQFDDLD